MFFVKISRKLSHIYGLAILSGLIVLTYLPIGGVSVIEAQNGGVPNTYYPNYLIQEQWDAILDDFIELEAKRKLGEDPSSTLFASINTNLRAVIPSLPAEGEFKIVYEQCLLSSASVSNGYSYDKFINFMENCFSPLNKTIREIGSKYTMKPQISANPINGSAPLTVTFDARGSKDPSNDTIPSSNFFWYYKDTNGVDRSIGQGPVVNHTFETEGTYIVHLTVRSANQSTKGIVDGATTIAVNVSPQAATLIVYANGQKLSETRHIKIGTQEAQRGVEFDGTPSISQGGRRILSHQWTLKQGARTVQQTDLIQGSPGTFNVQLANEGEYKIELQATDNENNSVTKGFLITVSDPIAIIRQSPENGTTETEFSFDASASYSVNSSLRLYTWEIYDDIGTKIITTQRKQINQRFSKPGTYTVKLIVEDELGEVNQEDLTIFVDSTKPSPQFTIEETTERLKPSQFTLDASLTTDPDVQNNVDSLTYEWIVSDPENTIITPTDQTTNKKVVIAFNRVAEHTVRLRVTDSFGQSAEIEKKIKVESALRPLIVAAPRATSWGETINFAVTSNKEIVNYQWDFGDNTTRIVQTNVVQYRYNEAGIYTVKLTVTDRDGDENQVLTDVFIGEKNSPIPAYTIEDNAGNIKKQDTSCTDNAGETHTAYEIQRQEEFRFNASESVNSKGRASGLEYFFIPQDEEIFSTNRLSHKFREVGCRYIDLIVEDSETTAQAQSRVWFKVINAIPTLDNISLFFPQFGNEVGIGFDQNNVQNIFDTKEDELIVKVIAHNAKDSDGQISTFTWYYYNKDDPNRFLEVKANPGNVPYAFFTLSKSALRGDFAFGVRMSDNDGGDITSEEIIGQGPSLFFLPTGEQSIDIPIVTLKTNTINTKVGEEVSFEVVSRILSQRGDFEANRTIEYDFGDGTNPIRTKKTAIKYMYEEPGRYTPKVKVTYRGNPGISYGETIDVQNALRANILTTHFDKIVMVRDLSMGSIENSSVCFDRTKCGAQGMLQTNQKEYVKKYADYGTYVLEYSVEDKFGNKATERRVLALQAPSTSSTINFVSVPEATQGTDGGALIRVGNNLNNEILLFLAYGGSGICYVDTNIARDEDGDGVSDNDRSMSCNAPKLIKYTPELGESQGRVYYEESTDGIQKLKTQDFTVDFIDYDSVLNAEQKTLYFAINELSNSIDDNFLGNAIIKDELVNIRDNLQNDSEVSISLIALDDYINDDTIADKQIVLTDQEQKQLDFIRQSLTTTDVLAAQGASVYFQAKQRILEYTPSNVQGDVQKEFFTLEQIAEPAKEAEQVKSIMQNILNSLISNQVNSDNASTDTITQEEIDLVVLPAICEILSFYAIGSELCPTPGSESVEGLGSTANEVASGGLITILKWLGLIVLILGTTFLAIVVFFAVRSRLRAGAPTP